MLAYERTEWYGITYLFRMSGSSLPRCLPWVVIAGFLGGFGASGLPDKAGWPIRDFFGHPYAMQVLGLVFGYLSITRLSVSYNRYWEGPMRMACSLGCDRMGYTLYMQQIRYT